MKITKKSPKNQKTKNQESEDMNFLEAGVTKRLLEKYRSKDIFNIKTINKKNNHNRAA